MRAFFPSFIVIIITSFFCLKMNKEAKETRSAMEWSWNEQARSKQKADHWLKPWNPFEREGTLILNHVMLLTLVALSLILFFFFFFYFIFNQFFVNLFGFCIVWSIRLIGHQHLRHMHTNNTYAASAHGVSSSSAPLREADVKWKT